MTQQESTTPVHLRLEDLARLFSVSRYTIYNWRKTGALDEITHFDPAGRPYFIADEVATWSRSRCSSPAGEVVA